MGKHIEKSTISFDLNDSLIIIVATIATIIIGDYISAAVILVFHQLFMFISYLMLRKYPEIQNHGYDFLRKLVRYITIALLAVAVIISVFIPLKNHNWDNCIRISVILLLVSCEYRLFESLNLALFSGYSYLNNYNVNISDINVFESVGKIKSIIFNKTGTITEDKYRLIGVFPKTISESQFMSLLLAVESKSNHLISKALDADTVSAEDVEIIEIQGKGVIGKYKGNDIIVGNASLLQDYGINSDIPDMFGTAVHLAVNSNYYGYIVLENKTRAGMYDSIEKLKHSGLDNLYLLSCDLQSIVQPISRALGFNVFKAELDNESKIVATQYIMDNKPDDSTVAYVGNADEMKIAKYSDISISFDDTYDSDVSITEGGIDVLPEVIKIAKNSVLKQKINLYISLISKCLVLFLLLLGVLSPIPATVILSVCAMVTFLISYERIRF